MSQLGAAKKTTRGRDSPFVRNLPLPFIEITCLEASVWHTAIGSYLPVVLAHHHRELVFPADLRTGIQQFWHTTTDSRWFQHTCV
jgi:hypothetical protein